MTLLKVFFHDMAQLDQLYRMRLGGGGHHRHPLQCSIKIWGQRTGFGF